MSEKKLIFSNQYGLLMILSEDNEILLNVTPLVQESAVVTALRTHLEGILEKTKATLQCLDLISKP